MNWGPGASGGFQNALAMGMQAGENVMRGYQMGRQAKEQREERNALSAFALNPNAETAAGVAPYNPNLAYKFGVDQREAAAEQRKAEIFDRALGGDAAAMDQLARIDYERFSQLGKDQKEALASEAKLFGDVSFDLLNTDPAARRDKFVTYAREFPQYAEQINQLAFDPPEEQERKLRSLALQAGLGLKLYEMDQPQQFNVGPGEGRYERDPRSGAISTVIQPNYGGATPFSPVNPPQSGAPTPADIDAELRRRGVL